MKLLLSLSAVLLSFSAFAQTSDSNVYSSYLVTVNWSKVAPHWDDSLASVWNASGQGHFISDDCGAQNLDQNSFFECHENTVYAYGKLAEMLDKVNGGRYPKKITEQVIEGIYPRTVRGLGQTLGW